MQSDFAIISIRILPECNERLRKVLRSETTYFLCNDYEDEKLSEGALMKAESLKLDVRARKIKDFIESKINA